MYHMGQNGVFLEAGGRGWGTNWPLMPSQCQDPQEEFRHPELPEDSTLNSTSSTPTFKIYTWETRL